MKKQAIVLVFALFFTLACIPVHADHGMPEAPVYTVAISIYGADWYSEYSAMESGSSSGRLTGGAAFYVWQEYDLGYWGTTDTNAGREQADTFIFILKSDAVSDTEPVSPDAGQREAATVQAITDDELNMRCGPGTGFKVVKVIGKGTEVTYDYTFTTDTRWMYVQADGTSGWVCGDYLETVDAPAVTDSGTGSQPYGDTAKSDDTGRQNTVNGKKELVAGIILICIGAAILIAAFVVYYLRKKK